MSEDRSAELVAMRAAARAVGVIGQARGVAAKAKSAMTFPYRAPTIPTGVQVPKAKSRIGGDFETEWARTAPAKAARAAIVEGPMRAMVKVLANPDIDGLDRLSDLRNADPVPSAIFVANHHSHLDTPLMITSIPSPWRHHLVVGAAADYFFTSRVKGSASALALNAFPVERNTVGRASIDLAGSLIADGYSLLIYPEGGRSPDGWAQDFHRGAAFLAKRCSVPVVPVHLDGTGQIFGKGMNRPSPGKTVVTFGAPMWLGDDEDTRDFSVRIERAVAELGDESASDWWTARRNAARGITPGMSGPEASSWRRTWQLTSQRRAGRTSRVTAERAWPHYD